MKVINASEPGKAAKKNDQSQNVSKIWPISKLIQTLFLFCFWKLPTKFSLRELSVCCLQTRRLFNTLFYQTFTSFVLRNWSETMLDTEVTLMMLFTIDRLTLRSIEFELSRNSYHLIVMQFIEADQRMVCTNWFLLLW